MPGAPDFSRPTSLLKPDLTLLGAVRSGRGAMPAYQGLLRDRDILDIVAHLRTFRCHLHSTDPPCSAPPLPLPPLLRPRTPARA